MVVINFRISPSQFFGLSNRLAGRPSEIVVMTSIDKPLPTPGVLPSNKLNGAGPGKAARASKVTIAAMQAARWAAVAKGKSQSISSSSVIASVGTSGRASHRQYPGTDPFRIKPPLPNNDAIGSEDQQRQRPSKQGCPESADRPKLQQPLCRADKPAPTCLHACQTFQTWLPLTT